MKEKIKEQIAVSFTYNTNAIEGSTITLNETREILEHGIAPNKPLRDIKEAEAHAKIFLRMLEQKGKISRELILLWHKELFNDTKQDISGTFRKYLVRVGSYLAPDWQDVEKLIKDMVLFCKKNKRMNAIELAARVHYKFEKIHPFGDGNGRIGRLLMNSILWHNNYPLIIIEYKKRKAYYKALQNSEDKFFAYFSRTYLKVHGKYLK
jgi:Fic family protein